jgi:hypothetical protein
MDERARDLPPNFLAAVMTVVVYLATVIMVFGFLSLFLDRDVIAERDAGTVLGPTMVAAAVIVTFVAMVRLRAERPPWWAAAVTVTSTYLVMITVAGLGYAVARREPFWAVLYLQQQAGSPFVIAAALLSGAAIITFWAVSARAGTGNRGIDRGDPDE